MSGNEADLLNVIASRDIWCDDARGIIDITAPRSNHQFSVAVSDQVLARDMAYFARILAEASPKDRQSLSHYVAFHAQRFIHTFRAIRPGGGADRLLDVAAFYPFTYCVFKESGYGELRCTAYRPDDVQCQTVRHELRDSRYDVEIRLDVEVLNLEKDRFPYPDEYFATALCLETLAHLQADPMAMMAEFNRVLRMDGEVLISTSNVTSCFALGSIVLGQHPNGCNKFLKDGTNVGRHSREYTPAEVRALLEAAGFETISLETVDIWGPGDPWMLEVLKFCNASTDLRGSCIFAKGRKRHQGIVDRYPSQLYA